MPLLPARDFLTWIQRFERVLARLLAVLLTVVMAATCLQLVLSTLRTLVLPEQDWLAGDLLVLLDRMLLLLIGLEVLQNLTAYLRDHAVQIELVLLTALTAVARKVIVMPPNHDKDPQLLIGMGVVILCLATAHALVRRNKNLG